MTLSLTELWNADGKALLICKKPVESDHPVYLGIECLELSEFSSDFDEKWHVVAFAVSPGFAGKEGIEMALECNGSEEEEANPLRLCESLYDYGIHAVVWQGSGNNRTTLMRTAREELTAARFLFGFYMDRQHNLFGNTGWDFLSGNTGWKGGESDR